MIKLISVNQMFEIAEDEAIAQANSPEELAKEAKRSEERLARLAARPDVEEVEEADEDDEDEE